MTVFKGVFETQRLAQIVPGRRRGVVIGIDRYQNPLLNLRCAVADAQSIYELMIDPEIGMFDPEFVTLLLDEQATTTAIKKALSRLKSADPEDTVWIYYAGHAAPENNSVYWVTHDAEIDDLDNTALNRRDIEERIAGIHARQVVQMLDCCYSAATAAQTGQTRGALTPREVFGAFEGEGNFALTASNGQQKSVELRDVNHGAFTWFLQEGLRGAADASGDGVVTAQELWDYLYRKVEEASAKLNNRQTPMLLGQMTHGVAMTLNPMVTETNRALEGFLDGLAATGEDGLSAAQVAYCQELMWRQQKTPAERAALTLLQQAASDPGARPGLRAAVANVMGEAVAAIARAAKPESTRIKNSGRIYLVLDGLARPVPSDETYGRLFQDMDGCIAAQELGPVGAPLTAAAYLAGDRADGRIYLVNDGQRRWIQNSFTFERFHFHWGKVLWDQAREEHAPEFPTLPIGAPINLA